MLSNIIQAGLPRANFAIAAQLLGTYEFEEEIGNALVVREPIGVVGCITPWNYPLHQIALKVAPALAAGNTVVLKPSEVAPINAFILAEVVHEAGLPAGVFNLVTGLGPVVGEAIVAHAGVDMVSFTGSTRAGKRVAEVASQTVKKVALELGGKSANIILDDADFAKAVADGVGKCYAQLGPDLHRARPACSYLAIGLAEVEQLAAGGRLEVHPRQPVRQRPPASGRWCLPHSASGCAASSSRASTRVPPLSTGGTETPAGSGAAATSSPRPCSATSPAT